MKNNKIISHSIIMDTIHVKIEPLKYKTNKCVNGNKGNTYISFTGFEIPNFNDQTEDPKKREIFLNDEVVYKNSENSKDNNNGMVAIVKKVLKPLEITEKIQIWKRKTGQVQNIDSYPVKEPLYNLEFRLSKYDQDENNINIEGGHERNSVEKEILGVKREHILSYSQKQLMVKISKKNLPKTSKERKKYVEKKVDEALKLIFKKGTQFVPKFVDKSTKNYETEEEYSEKELGIKPKAKLRIVGDMVVATTSNYDKTFERPKQKYIIMDYTIDSIDFNEKELNKEDKNYSTSQITHDFYKEGNLDVSIRLVSQVASQLKTISKNPQFDNTRFLNNHLQIRNYKYFKDTNSEKRRDSHANVLKYYMINKVLRYDKGDKEKPGSEKEDIKKWIEYFNEEKVFDFMDDNFFKRKGIQQLFLINQIVGQVGNKGLFTDILTTRNVTDNNKNKINDIIDKIKNINKKSFSGNISVPISVNITFFLQGEKDLSAKLGISINCDKSMAQFKNWSRKLFGTKKKKKKKKTKKLNYIISKGGRKKRKKPRKKPRKNPKKTRNKRNKRRNKTKKSKKKKTK
tara:strand:+ start:1872 stop:3584 length:1713 start_codon:yes stop_codon:yes gene_type:complete